MSLLLDALKKAADDKKKSVDEPADKSPVQDNNQINDEDSLELELDEKQLTENDAIDDNDFPRVEDQPIAPQKPQASSTEAVAENTVEHLDDTASESRLQNSDHHADTDTEHTEKPVELEPAATENTHTEATDEPAQTPAKPQVEKAISSTTDSPDSVTDTDTVYPPQQPATAAEAVDTVSSAIHQAGRTRHSADNEAALSALINKSNQYQQRAQKKRMILLAVLILLLISGSAGFFYLKADMASQQLYIAQNTRSPLLGEPAATDKPQQASGNQSVVTASNNRQNRSAESAQLNNTASQAASTEAAINKPPTPQKVRLAGDTVTRNASNKATEAKIHIQQSSREDPVESLIMNAYNAFQRGDYGRAENLYQQVLTDEPRNRDATLGLAAIALKQQRYEYAKQKYLALLQLNPKDSLAIAGLSSLSQVSAQNLADSGLSESQLKFMLKEQPDAAHLYFALGSLYAAKNQWPQAQSAYFSAWSGDSNQADYAFNLAVSLDHINQPQQALQYYQLSLKLMRSSAANFSATQVEQRINSLQEAMR